MNDQTASSVNPAFSEHGSYESLSNQPLVEKVDNSTPFTIKPTLSEHESHESILDQPLVENMVDLIPPFVDRIFPLKSVSHTN